MIGLFPEWMLNPDRQEDVEIYLANLPLTPKEKKQAIVWWCKYVGVALTKEKVKKVLGDDYGKV